ncbi:MAG: Hpt domain-containing protein [Rhizobiales bacterium]|nr:Hpt domain-containing protein [Hyphomicrobiales bacterium]
MTTAGVNEVLAEVRSVAVLDFGHLARYTLGNRNLEDEILALFLTETERLVAGLGQAADGTAWKAAAHGIKGSARGVGAFAIGEIAAHCEAAGRPGNDAHRAALIEWLHTELERVRRAIAAR